MRLPRLGCVLAAGATLLVVEPVAARPAVEEVPRSSDDVCPPLADDLDALLDTMSKALADPYDVHLESDANVFRFDDAWVTLPLEPIAALPVIAGGTLGGPFGEAPLDLVSIIDPEGRVEVRQLLQAVLRDPTSIEEVLDDLGAVRSLHPGEASLARDPERPCARIVVGGLRGMADGDPLVYVASVPGEDIDAVAAAERLVTDVLTIRAAASLRAGIID